MSTAPHIPIAVPVIHEGSEAKDIFQMRDERDDALNALSRIQVRLMHVNNHEAMISDALDIAEEAIRANHPKP